MHAAHRSLAGLGGSRRQPLWLALLLASLPALPGTARAVPHQESGELSGLVGTATALAVSADGRYVAASEQSGGGLALWDSRAFSDGAQTPSVCGGARAAVFATGSAEGERIFVGCGDGIVHVVDLDTAHVPPLLEVSDPITLNSGVGDVVSLVWAPGDDVLFATVQEGTVATLHRMQVDAAGGSDGVALGIPLTATVTEAAIGEAGTPLVLVRSDGYLVRHARSGQSFGAGTSFPLLALGQISGIAVSSQRDTILVAESSADEVWAFPATGSEIPLSFGGGFESPTSVAFGEAPGDPVVYVATATQAAYAIDPADESEMADYELGGSTPGRIAAVRAASGNVYVSSSDGSIRVLTDLPFLRVDASPVSVGEGEPFTLTFTSTEAGSWDVRVGGDGSEDSGTSLGTGEVEAGVEAELALSADDLPEEGANRLFVLVEGETGTGVDSASVVRDTPPQSVGAVSIAAGDERLSVSWMATDEEDIASYEVFVSDSEFDAGSLPAFDVETEEGTISYPVEIDAGEAEAEQSYSIDGLANGQTYWVAVRATDETGQTGPLSDVVSGIPAASCGAAECAGDPGCSCDSAGEIRPSLLAVIAIPAIVMACVARRRRGE